ncbi:uncharacterized protein LOC108108319 isoform X3 [Drosophila eugracilis]|uniref:uncharacterized protein LOC108108319 isoform X3 n=1 Tax=Drosophila eugracilis TaxID=29029 RepID=UPI0007E609A5|nr:uncharacterized protein LOC108108319 isoform X3 [Drosophila eugracilis]
MFLDLTLTPGLDYPEVPVDGLGCPPGTRGRRPHPHDVYKFLQCGIGVKAQVEQCPQGMIFDSSSLVCVNSDPSRTSYLAFAEVNYLMCPIGAVGLFAHPFDQTKFLNCKDGKVAVQSCQHNYVFSISRGYCQIKTLLAYSDYVSLIISQTNYEYSLILNACPFGVNGIHLYPYDAEKYVQCSSGGRMSIISCGPHKAFSVSQRSCLSRQVVQITDRVKFWEEIQVQTTVVSQNNNRQGRLSPSISCPHNVEKNYAYPFHAGHYIKCQNGVLEIVCCPTGQVYSLSQRRCLSRNYLQVHDYLDYQYISNDFSTEFMVDRSTLTCPPNIQGYYLHPFDCTKFVSCYNQQTFIESCPTGKIFSFSNQKCVPKEECKGSTDHVEYLIETTVITTYEENGPKHENIGDLTCPTGSSGPYPHPFDCTKFLQCSNGQTFIQKCGPGTAFSTAIKNCDFINNVDCSARHLSPGLNQVNHDNQGPSQSPNPSSPTAGHLSDISCPSGVNGQFVHPFDQTKFFLCLAGKLTVQSCQPLYVFSISKGSCQPKTQLVYSDYVRYIVSQISIEQTLNLIACPDGTNGIHPYPYDAGKYVRCSEGQLSVLSCGPQAAFSVVNQACGPSSQIDRQDRVKFWEELVIQTTTTDTNLDNQYDTIPLSSCPASLQGNYTYPFDSNKFVNCQNGRLTIRKCPQTAVYSLPRRQCISDDLLVTVEYLDHGYIFKLFSNSLTEDFSTLVCPTEAEGFHLYPFDCTKYLICKNKQTHVASCKQGEAFSISQRSCVLIDEITLLNDHVECSEEESEEEESEEDRGYAPDGVQQTSGKYQQPSQSSEGRNPPHQPNGGYQQPSQGYGDYQSPSQASGGYQPPYQPNGSNRPTSPNGRPHQQPSSQPGGEYQPHINNGGYQPSFSTNWQPNQTHGAYLPPSQASGGYQPPYNTNGSNQPTSQNGRPHQQPTSQPSGVFQPPYATTGGYQPSPTAWGNQQSNQTHGGYQLPSQAIGGYQPPYNTNGSYQQPSFQPSGVYQPQYATNGGSQPSSSYDWGYQQPNQTHGVYQTPSQPYPSPPYNTNGHQPSSNETYGDRTSSQINGGYQIPHPTNGDYQPSSQTTGGYQKPNIIYGDSQSPSYVSGRVQSQTALDYQQYNDIYEGYQPTSYPNGGYQPGYNTNGSYQQSPQNGRDYQQPNRTYGDQTSSQTTGGYRPPSQASGIFQPSSQTSGGYQIPYPANGDYQPSSQIGWIYQQQNQTYGSSPPHLNGGIQSSSHTTWGSQTNGVLQHPSQTDQGYQPASRSNGGYQTPPQVNLYPSLPTALMCPEKVSGLFPNPFDATGYLTCIEGHTLARQCQPLDIFSISQGYCLPEQHVAKTDRVPFENKLLPQNDPLACPKDLVGFFAYPFDCSKYLSCGPNGMELLRCPIEQHYSISHGFCQPLDQVKREDRLYTLSELHIIYEWTQRMMIAGAVTTCPEGITGTLPHPRFATKYIRCGPGQAEMFDCPSPKVFSVSRRMCLMDDKLRSDDRTDYIVLGASVYWTAPANDNRQSKSFETSGLNQFGNQYTTRTTTTTRVIGDRWTNMNMQRPSGFGLDQNPHHQQQPEYSPGWVTQEISYVQHAPGQNTLYVEGSLQPNHARETSRTEQTLDPSTTYTSTDFQRSTRRAEFDQNTPTTTTMKNNWLASGHNRDYHRRHPNLPDPFSKHHSNPPSHQHHPHQHHQHNADFHRRHPELPNPFPQKDETGQQEELEDDWELMVNPNAEEVTPKLAARSSFNRECDFDCGNGKCLKMDEVCNGQKNCDNGKDEVNCPPLDYEVRLTGGETPNTGRIEVKANGQWGYVCDDKFGLKDADVVCRELGFQMGAQEVRGSSYYPPPNQDFNYLMDEVECHGNETKLSECTFKGWGIHNCGVDEVAGVTCKVPVMKCPNDYWLCHTSKECIPPAFVCDNTPDCADKSDECAAVCQAPVQYRLEGGRNSNEGRLEVKHHGVWGSVCDDDFNLKSAQVACNSMGFYGPAKIEKNIFGNGNGPIWLDQVMCFGNETAIDQCNHWNWGEHNCNHTEDVALHCTAGPPPRSQKYFQSQLKGGMTVGQETAARTYSQIGLWERSSKALHTPRRCGIFKDDLTDEYAHREERVVRGNVAQRGRHPWQATIRTRGRGGISSHWCGAVVISKRHLLTAAHCLYGNPKGAYFVRVGDHYANIAENSEVDTFIENWYTHEKFRKGAHMNNDIAVVVLKTPLRFNDYVQPICLPDKKSDLVEGRKCTISGWGSIKSGVSTPAQVLGSAELPILADNVCKQSNVYGSAMSDGMFCAGSMDESVDACEGDSGGPLVCSDDDGETLYGLISWGQHCGYKNRPGVYVRVSHYIDWIYEKINESLKRL